jgi:hypothetical protein
MSLSITVTPVTAAPIEFLAISTTSGKQAIDFDAGAALQQQFRFKSVGVAGQFLVRASATGRTISVVVRYLNAKATAEAAYQADAAILVSQQVQLAANGQTYPGCNVLPESIRRTRPIRPVGRGGANQVYFDVTMHFTQDNPGGL